MRAACRSPSSHPALFFGLYTLTVVTVESDAKDVLDVPTDDDTKRKS